jgi:hypothetical protein
MSQQDIATALDAIQVARRDALVDYYIAHCVPNTSIEAGGPLLSDRVTTPDDLYEYLLLDTKIGPEEKTSWVAEAIISVQLYINRCLGGYDPDVNNAGDSTMVRESRPGGFLYDWPDYNSVYSTWAGRERLQYYPSVYIDPSLRYNKTVLFNTLEETINQGRISDQRVQKGFQQYLLGFETLANLETISGYQAGTTASADCRDTLYFIGRTQSAPHDYYWRCCNMAIRNDTGQISGDAWSQWLKIEAPLSDAEDDIVRPCWFNNRLYICWVSKEQSGASGTSNVKPIYQYHSNVWYLPEGGGWTSYKKDLLAEKPAILALVNYLSTSELRILVYEDNSEISVSAVFADCIKTLNSLRVPVGTVFTTGSGFSDTQLKVLQISDTRVLFQRTGFASSEKTMTLVSYAGTQTFFDLVQEGSINYYCQFEQDTEHFLPPTIRYSPNMGYVYCGVRGQAPLYDSLFYLDIGRLLLNDVVIANLTTDSASFFASKLLLEGIPGLLSYNTQTTPIELNNTAPIDFNGSYGLYFWEIFFHSSFLIADRYLTEQNYGSAEEWYQYIFTPTGYRNRDGLLEQIGGEVRHWNVVPLQQDHSWNAAIPPTVDPDVIAMNDPMHYKMAIFLNSVNALIERGDSCYRMLQRDYMAQAKMYYLEASQMLGPRPQIDYTNSWPNPTVGEEAAQIAVVDFDDPDAPAPTVLSTLLRAYLAEQNGNFLPPYNVDLLIYWDKLEVRLFNLRHGLSLDGQPLLLPLFATPVNPRDLQVQHGAGNGLGGNSVPANQMLSEYRFVVLVDKARAAVANVIQFGSELQAALVERDNTSMTLLVQTQQQQIAALTQEMQVDNIASLTSAIAASREALKGARVRLQHYSGLYNNWISASEETAMNLRVTAGALNAAAMIPMAVGAGVEMAPNTFGLACGGSRWGGVARAVAYGLQGGAALLETSAQRLDISEQYRRRRQEWQIQRDNAASEVASLEAQIQSQHQQLAMANKQSALYLMELDNLRAQYNLQTSRFTGLELFNWMTARLAALYYQLYDAALALCLTSKGALVREVGTDQAVNLFVTPMWNDLYQGLLAGEGLLLELQKMDNTYLRVDKRGLEILKTVSLNTQITTADSNSSFAQLLSACLAGTDTSAGGVSMGMLDDKLTIAFDLATLRLDTSYGSNGKVGRFKNISVTLPALLGPYQNVEATLALGGTYVALSRGLDDSGIFMADFNDPKYLPFEGDPTDAGNLILTFFHAGTGGSQRALVDSLVDVIYQLRYTLKDN